MRHPGEGRDPIVGGRRGTQGTLGPGLRRGDEKSVIPGERSETRDPSFDGTRSERGTLGPGLRRGDEKSVIAGECSETRDPSFDGTRSERGTLGPGLRRGDKLCVIPAKAGIQLPVVDETPHSTWDPACAGATQPGWA
jgi:hypothetical protein